LDSRIGIAANHMARIKKKQYKLCSVFKFIMECCEEVTGSGFRFNKQKEISDTNGTTSSHLSLMPLNVRGGGLLLTELHGICETSTVMLNLKFTQQLL
jgi:hypothetical protein